MLLFSEFSKLMKEEHNKRQLYISVKPDKRFARALQNIVETFNVPKPHDLTKMHCTLIYSKKPVIWPVADCEAQYSASFEKFHVFHSRDGSNVLVAKLASSDLQRRHNELMKSTDASYDFPAYLPHVTISYDIGDFDIKTINTTMIPPVVFSGEMCESLDEEEE